MREGLTIGVIPTDIYIRNRERYSDSNIPRGV